MKRAAILLLLIVACSQPKEQATPQPKPIGDAAHGKAVIETYGCTTCHIIPGTSGHGEVGPSLAHVASRPVIARTVKNDPPHMIAYLQNPEASDPNNQMPNLGVTPADARDITAYLVTLK